jgi:hypothetical protein
MPLSATAQQSGGVRPVIDTIIVEVDNVFRAEEATTPGKRFMNALHVPTKRHVILHQLLLRPGDPYDSLLAAESERDLRLLGLFSTIDVDTVRLDGALALRVRGQDGVSLLPTVSLQVIGSTFLWSLGATEKNLVGRGGMVRAAYRQEVDRSGWDLGARFGFVAGTQIDVDGGLERWSDGNVGYALVGDPYRSNLDRRAIVTLGSGVDRRVLQYRTEATVDTTTYRQTGYLGRVDLSHAPVAEATQFVRVGFTGQIKREEFALIQDTGQAVPDSLTGAIGLFSEYESTRFRELAPQINGSGAAEDLDLSVRARVGVWVAHEHLGYERSGIGLSLRLEAGAGGARGFVKGEVATNGLFSGGGLDSGRVDVNLTLGLPIAPRHWDLLYVAAGMLDNPPPGGEYDLGAGSASAQKGCGNATLCATGGSFEPTKAFLGPRLFGPHSFTGTRTIWGTYEHRWWLVDDIAGWFGLAVAGFFDMGGAWYEDQDPRFGGNFGLGLRLGGIRGTGASFVRLDAGFLFGDGASDGIVIGFGGGFAY